ncbi:SpoIIE family protein phosphatase [Streptomyces sp. NPDC054804]
MCDSRLRIETTSQLTYKTMPSDLARQARAADLAVIAEGAPTQQEELIALPDGSRDFLTSLFPLKTASGSTLYAVCGVITDITDITDRVAAQREVRRANRRYPAVLESAPDALLITDGTRCHRHGQCAGAKVVGSFVGRPRGPPVADLVPALRRRRHSALLRAYLRQADPKPIILDRGLYGLRSDGVEFPVEVNVSSLQAPGWTRSWPAWRTSSSPASTWWFRVPTRSPSARRDTSRSSPPGGPARILRTPVGVPLGVNDPCSAGVPFRKATRPVPPGSTLAVYTDGLVERPGTDIETQIDTRPHARLGAERSTR